MRKGQFGEIKLHHEVRSSLKGDKEMDLASLLSSSGDVSPVKREKLFHPSRLIKAKQCKQDEAVLLALLLEVFLYYRHEILHTHSSSQSAQDQDNRPSLESLR